MKYCITFVSQKGEMEIGSLLLLYTLKKNFKEEHEIKIAIPNNKFLFPSPEDKTIDIMKEFGCDFYNVNNVFEKNMSEKEINKIPLVSNDYKHHIPFANKIDCLNLKTECKKILFLDTDILVLNNFYHNIYFEKPTIMARIEWTDHYGNELFEELYSKLNISKTNTRFKLVRSPITSKKMFPYYNTGVILINSNTEYSTNWNDYCYKSFSILKNIYVKKWSEQVSFPFHAINMNMKIRALPLEYNWPIRVFQETYKRCLGYEENPIFLHYQDVKFLEKEEKTYDIIKEACEEISYLKCMMKNSKNWQNIIRRFF